MELGKAPLVGSELEHVVVGQLVMVVVLHLPYPCRNQRHKDWVRYPTMEEELVPVLRGHMLHLGPCLEGNGRT